MKIGIGRANLLLAASLSLAMMGCKTPDETAPQCHPMVSADGEAKLQSAAQLKARLNWRDKVGPMYGQPYKNWNRAKNSSINCRHDGRNAILRRWTCTASAEPCRN